MKLAFLYSRAWWWWIHSLHSVPWSLVRCQQFSQLFHRRYNCEQGGNGTWQFYIMMKVDVFSGALWNISQNPKGCEVQTATPCTGIQQTASLSDAWQDHRSEHALDSEHAFSPISSAAKTLNSSLPCSPVTSLNIKTKQNFSASKLVPGYFCISQT